jgi:hypothetical protein
MGNALAHRDYELMDPVRVTAFADRVEIVSPGPLPLGVDAAAFERGEAPPKWRNQTLAWFFNRLQIAQAEGQGIPTILRSMREEGCPPPVFRTTALSVTCLLPANPRHVLEFAIADVQQAVSARDFERARNRVEFILQHLDPSAKDVVTSPQRLIDVAASVAVEDAVPQRFRALVSRLLETASTALLSDGDLLRAADICFRYRDITALTSVVENQLNVKPQLQKSGRFLSLAGELFVRMAVQAAASIGSPHVPSENWPGSIRDFNAAAEEARNYLSAALTLGPDDGDETIIRRALGVIQHLVEQVAGCLPPPNDNPSG